MEFSGEILFGFFEIVAGVTAVIIMTRAKSLLGEGLWGKTLSLLIFSLIFLTLASTSHTLRELFELKEKLGGVVEYPEYLFGIIAFSGFLASSLKIIKAARE